MGLGGLKDAPEVPDARETAGFQTGTNIGTTLLNQALGNTKTASPYGTTSFKQRKKKNDFVYTDPYTNEEYRIPTFKEVTKLKPKEREQFKLQQATETNLLRLARDQSAQLGDYLSTPFSLGEFDFGADLGVGAYQPRGLGVGPYQPGGPLATGTYKPQGIDAATYRPGQELGAFELPGAAPQAFTPGGAMKTSPLAPRGDIMLPEGVRAPGSDQLTLGNEATEARLFELGSRRLDPKFARDRASLQSSLLARGIREGSDAWKAATGTFNEGENDAYNSLLLSGRAQAAAETQAEYDARVRDQETAFGQAVTGRQLTAAEQGQAFQQELAARGLTAAEQAQQFGQQTAGRQLTAAEQAQRFAQQAQARGLSMEEQAQEFAQALQRGEFGMNEQMQAFGQDLAARGLSMQEQMQAFQQALSSGQFGMQEQAQQFGQTLADRQRMLAERGQQTSEAFATRSQPINEIAALLGSGQVTVPQLTGQQQPQSPITDVAGIINNNWDQQFKAWQAESQATQGMLGGLFGMAGNILSDRRLKDDIEQVGQTPEGLPIYEFRVGDDGEMQSGVMAQDVEQVMPEAVQETPEGIKTVNYDMAVGAGDGTYTVQKGDNLWDIGKRFNAPVQDIVAANAIPNPDMIQPGQVLTIPGMAAPGPEAIRYDPLSSGNAGGVASVAEALQPAFEGNRVSGYPDSFAPLGPLDSVPSGVGANQAAMGAARQDGSFGSAYVDGVGGLMADNYPAGAGGGRPDPTRRPWAVPQPPPPGPRYDPLVASREAERGMIPADLGGARPGPVARPSPPPAARPDFLGMLPMSAAGDMPADLGMDTSGLISEVSPDERALQGRPVAAPTGAEPMDSALAQKIRATPSVIKDGGRSAPGVDLEHEAIIAELLMAQRRQAPWQMLPHLGAVDPAASFGVGGF